MTGIKELRSVCIRVAWDFPGLAAGLPDRLGTGSALILGPPGAGKTTLLRDLIRQISDGKREPVAVADQRGSCSLRCIMATNFRPAAAPSVLTGAGKGEGMELLLRSMGPKWIAVDEITALEDCAAMEQCATAESASWPRPMDGAWKICTGVRCTGGCCKRGCFKRLWCCSRIRLIR